MFTHRACLGGFFAFGLILLIGCDGKSVAEVKGTVKFNGKPIEKGTIQFFPAEGTTGGTAGGEIIDGQYTVKVSPGLMKVQIGCPKLAGKKKLYDTPDSPERPLYQESLPEKYSKRDMTELELEVKPGINEKDWDLKSD